MYNYNAHYIYFTVYAIAVVFLIASHVFVKKKEDTLDYQMRMVKKYWEESHFIKEIGARESFKKLKHSMVPAVAKSNARDLISRRKSFAPILANAGINLEASTQDNDLEKSNAMPSIQEESGNEEEGEDYVLLPSTTVNFANENTGKKKETKEPSQNTSKTDNRPNAALPTAKRKASCQSVTFSDTPKEVQEKEAGHQKCSWRSSLQVPDIHVTISPFSQENGIDTIEEEYLSTAAVNRAFQKSPVNVRVSPCEIKSEYYGNSLHPLSAEGQYLLQSFDDTNSEGDNSKCIDQSPTQITASPFSSKNSLDCYVKNEQDQTPDGLYHITL